jgi:hypothetical protein
MVDRTQLFECPGYAGHAQIMPGACVKRQARALEQHNGSLYGRHGIEAVDYGACFNCPTGRTKRAEGGEANDRRGKRVLPSEDMTGPALKIPRGRGRPRTRPIRPKRPVGHPDSGQWVVTWGAIRLLNRPRFTRTDLEEKGQDRHKVGYYLSVIAERGLIRPVGEWRSGCPKTYEVVGRY